MHVPGGALSLTEKNNKVKSRTTVREKKGGQRSLLKKKTEAHPFIMPRKKKRPVGKKGGPKDAMSG